MPTILKQPNDVKINVCKTVVFKCTAQSFGELKIVWKRVKYNMPVTAKMTEEKSLNKITSILNITKTAGYYSGRYYCVAENQAGKVASRFATLYVQGS